jgi:tetratricopeptide (TPR) repeat protein
MIMAVAAMPSQGGPGRTVTKEALLDSLELELAFQGRHDELHAALRDRIDKHPDDERLWISLAGQSLYHLGELQRAQSEIEIAISLAKKSGNFQRHALNTKARVALALGNYKLFENCLREIVDLRVLPGQRDIAPESDFFDRADKSRLSREIVSAYQDFIDAWRTQRRE